MDHRERFFAMLHFEEVDRLPVVHFGIWNELFEKWVAEGRLDRDEAAGYRSIHDYACKKLGFDYGPENDARSFNLLYPAFEERTLETMQNGAQKVFQSDGATVIKHPGIVSIPQEVDHLLKTRADWEEHYKHRLQYCDERVEKAQVYIGDGKFIQYDQGGNDFLKTDPVGLPRAVACGSMAGRIRNILGLEGFCYMQVDDPGLFDEIVDTVGDLQFRCLEAMLKGGAKFDLGRFWEDICFKSGPLIRPDVFREKMGPHYNRMTSLLREHGVDIVDVDCDGKIDDLVPVWVDNGVNTMFPIEVGTWNASIKPWRELYGKKVLGIGGVNKHVFEADFAAVDKEIERIRPLIDLGGYIPCPDHRIPVDAKWDNIRYYCDRKREIRP